MRIQQKPLALPDASFCALRDRFAQRMHTLSCGLLACRPRAYHVPSLPVQLAGSDANADCFDYFVDDFVEFDVLVYADSIYEEKRRRKIIS